MNDQDCDPRLARIIADYECRRDQGEPVDREELLKKHPEFAEDLRDHLDDVARAEALRRIIEGQLDFDTVTYITGSTVGNTNYQELQLAQAIGAETFGKYVIQRFLGDGAMGRVYQAFDTELQRQVALKIPKANLDEDSDLRRRFLREAQAAAGLGHPNICEVHDCGQIGGRHFICMKYLDGKPLARDANLRDADAAAKFVLKIAKAMAFAHEKGVVHRDLKHDNIIIDENNEPIITDFGLAATSTADQSRLTHTGMIIGTPAYMSPEQINVGAEAVDGRSDQFSLGVIFYELLSGEMPFKGSTATNVWTKTATYDPPAPRRLRPELDAKLDSICMKMLAKNPEDRYTDMERVAEELQDYLAAQPVGAARVQGWLRNSLILVSALVLLGLVFVLRTPMGDVKVTVNDPDLKVTIGDQTIEFTDNKKQWNGKTKVEEQRLALNLNGVEIPFDTEKKRFVLEGHKIAITLRDVQMTSDHFRVVRGDTTALDIVFTKNRVASRPAPTTTPAQAGATPTYEVAQRITGSLLRVRAPVNGRTVETIGVATDKGIVTVFPGKWRDATLVRLDGGDLASCSVVTRSDAPFCWLKAEIGGIKRTSLNLEGAATGWFATVDKAGKFVYERFTSLPPSTPFPRTAAVFDDAGALLGFHIDHDHLFDEFSFSLKSEATSWFRISTPKPSEEFGQRIRKSLFRISAQQRDGSTGELNGRTGEMLGVATMNGIVTVFPGLWTEATAIQLDGIELGACTVATREVNPFCWLEARADMAPLPLNLDGANHGWIVKADQSGELTFERFTEYPPQTSYSITTPVFDDDGALLGFHVDHDHNRRTTGWARSLTDRSWFRIRVPDSHNEPPNSASETPDDSSSEIPGELKKRILRNVINVAATVQGKKAQMISVATEKGIVTVFPGTWQEATAVQLNNDEIGIYSVATRELNPFCWLTFDGAKATGAPLNFDAVQNGWIVKVDAEGELSFERFTSFPPRTNYSRTAPVFDDNGALLGFHVDADQVGRVSGYRSSRGGGWFPVRAPE